jgi:hypothetical protein
MKEKPTRPFGKGGDPLAAMYFLAAAAMGVAALIVIAAVFLPRDIFSGSNEEDVIHPGEGTHFVPETPAAPVDSATAAAAAAEAEEMHYHDH